ncbi:hypothetical protein Q3O60_04945 [Alkalimonas collagenimarina]|uniref:Tetratricopeptide repeat protein n=1 Tax=Alkalimonas collagenimarina TaxID=400390 RepID=A0ABT9GWU5_9GAMM|nr:hypothetical protein [Alkalimonas collagenimarina]MDP4535535.1 hypothetical protein [Alkalimonas collagenimarina]
MSKFVLHSLYFNLVMLLLIGCTTPPSAHHSQPVPKNQAELLPTYADIPINHQLFLSSDTIKVPKPDALFELSDQAQEEFLQFFYDETRQSQTADKRLLSFLERRYDNFNYFGQTLKAADTLQGELGNCLSLAILTTAYANLVDVNTSYQMVYSVPIYELVDDILYVSSHVRTRISSPTQIDRTTGQFSFSRTYVDYFPTSARSRGQRITEPLFISMYYQNVAAELLKEDAREEAFTYLKKALEIAPDNVAALNSLAVLHRRQHDEATAEKLYHFILEHYPVNLSVVVNFREMLMLQGRNDEAEKLEQMIATIDDPNPYEWIALAQESIELNRLHRAERYLQKAEQLAPYVDEIYFQYARIDFMRGRLTSAQRNLVTAQRHARSKERRTLYNAKLGVLNESD